VRRSGALWLLAGLVLCLAALTPAAAQDRADTVTDTGGQVLVLLRLPPPHLRPGGDYGGSYGDGAGRAARHRIAAAIARRNGLALVDDWPMPLLGLDCFVMTVPVGRSSAAIATTLSNMPDVAWSQPVATFIGQAAVPRPDPLFQAQPAAAGWHLADLHRIADGRGVRVAIIDSAIERNHPDLAGQVAVSANFIVGRRETPEQHGTAVAGIIAAIADNGIGIAGIAPRARLLALRACWQPSAGGNTICDSFSLAKALYFAVDNGAGIINLSLGGPQDPLLARLLDVAMARGITVVAAFDRQRTDGGFPASHRGVIAVADDAPGALRSGVFTAPGRGIPTTLTGSTWSLVDGSSYAAAQVSGLFALMRGRAAANGGARSLISTRPDGGTIDSCASVLGTTVDRVRVCPAQITTASRP
jgi:hypothetical protein